MNWIFSVCFSKIRDAPIPTSTCFSSNISECSLTLSLLFFYGFPWTTFLCLLILPLHTSNFGILWTAINSWALEASYLGFSGLIPIEQQVARPWEDNLPPTFFADRNSRDDVELCLPCSNTAGNPACGMCNFSSKSMTSEIETLPHEVLVYRPSSGLEEEDHRQALPTVFQQEQRARSTETALFKKGSWWWHQRGGERKLETHNQPTP